MTRFSWFSLLPLMTALVLLLPGAAGAGEVKKFEDKGFEVEVPDSSWQWVELNSGMISDGFVAALGRNDGESAVMLHIRVIPNLESSVAELTENTSNGLRSMLPSVSRAETKKGSVSGVKGSLVVVGGKDNRDNPRLFRVFTIQAGNDFHQLMFRFDSGAEKTQAYEADALRRGYRLLKGGGEEQPEADFLEGAEEPSNRPDSSGPAGEAEEGEVQQDGNTLTFPSQNLKWSLPDGSPFAWTAITGNETAVNQMLARCTAEVEHPPKKGREDEGPIKNTAVILLEVLEPQPGWTPALFVKAPGVQMNIEEQMFDSVEPRTKAIEELEIGNYTGAMLLMVGKKDGKVVYFRYYAVSLKGKRYIWQVIFRGTRDGDADFLKDAEAVLKGVEFQETVEGIRGPLAIPGVAPLTNSKERGSRFGEEREIERNNYKAVKPADMYDLDFDEQSSGGRLRLAWETRTEDQQSYVYFDLQTYLVSDMRKEKKSPEDLIKGRESLWQQNAGSPQTIKKGKEPHYKASWGKGRGLGYEFKGYLGDAPFVERGFVVTYKKYLFWVRYQFGGRDAEKKFSALLKKLKKAVKFLRT